MKKLIFTGILATVVAVMFSVGIAYGRLLKSESNIKIPTTQTSRPIEQVAPTEEDQMITGGGQEPTEEGQEPVIACVTCPSPNPECITTCARQVVGRVLSITSNTDLGNSCSVEFQMNTRRVKLITPNQNEANANGTFNALCNRLALTLITGQLVQVGIAPIKTGEAYLDSVTLFFTPDPSSITYAKNLLEVLIDLTVEEFYQPTAATLPPN